MTLHIQVGPGSARGVRNAGPTGQDHPDTKTGSRWARGAGPSFRHPRQQREAMHAFSFGYAAREIVDDAIEHDADVIVIGSRGRSDLVGFILGSTAHKVMHLTDRPVLIVK
jgi:hypothetical protein